jgi:hypothetical protein
MTIPKKRWKYEKNYSDISACSFCHRQAIHTMAYITTLCQNTNPSFLFLAIIMPGTNNFKLSPFFLTIINRLEKLKVNIMKTGQDPRDNQPSHCSRNDNDATSCYNLGHDAGYASAKKRLPHLGF